MKTLTGFWFSCSIWTTSCRKVLDLRLCHHRVKWLFRYCTYTISTIYVSLLNLAKWMVLLFIGYRGIRHLGFCSDLHHLMTKRLFNQWRVFCVFWLKEVNLTPKQHSLLKCTRSRSASRCKRPFLFCLIYRCRKRPLQNLRIFRTESRRPRREEAVAAGRRRRPHHTAPHPEPQTETPKRADTETAIGRDAEIESVRKTEIGTRKGKKTKRRKNTEDGHGRDPHQGQRVNIHFPVPVGDHTGHGKSH